MDESSFVAYVGPPELHDGHVVGWAQHGERVTVSVQGDTGRRFALAFLGVAALHAIQPEGMELYALVEMTAAPPLRRFVFVNAADEDARTLELLAREFRVLDSEPGAA